MLCILQFLKLTLPLFTFLIDDVNVNRFAAYVKKHSDTQFIIITHRRGTMEVADIMYGVTMQEKGVSSFLKVDINDVEKKTGVKL